MCKFLNLPWHYYLCPIINSLIIKKPYHEYCRWTIYFIRIYDSSALFFPICTCLFPHPPFSSIDLLLATAISTPASVHLGHLTVEALKYSKLHFSSAIFVFSENASAVRVLTNVHGSLAAAKLTLWWQRCLQTASGWKT